MILPGEAASSYRIAPGVLACAPGLAFIESSASVVAADAHFAYEDVVGATLPMWSTLEGIALLAAAAARTKAREIIILGDIVHGPLMTRSAARAVSAGLDSLRAIAAVTLVAGNHEGRTRALDVLGPTHDSVERAGWTLLHGDRPQFAGARSMIGHLHPSIHLGGSASAPVFLAAAKFIAIPALTPYSRGLNITSRECAAALRRFGVDRAETEVVAATAELVYPFGNLADLCTVFAAPSLPARKPFHRPKLKPD